MALLDFDSQLAKDVKDIFLKEFSQKGIYKSSTTLKTIDIQFFEEPLDKLGTQYFHAWCEFDDISGVAKRDTLQVGSTVYGIVDFSPDEHQNGINLFLQEV